MEYKKTNEVRVCKVFTSENISEVLEYMLSYVEDCSAEDKRMYFNELVNLGLFGDACGKIVDADYKNAKVGVTFDY